MVNLKGIFMGDYEDRNYKKIATLLDSTVRVNFTLLKLSDYSEETKRLS